MKMREVAERFRHMLKVKDCRHLCLHVNITKYVKER